MELPTLKTLSQSRSTIKAFGGYNHTCACDEAEFYEGENLSMRNYPALSPRLPRTYLATLSQPNGICAKNGLLWVDGTALYYNGAYVGELENSTKQFCGFGSSVIIWPDKVAFDSETLALSSLGASWESIGDVSFTPCFENGETYIIETTGDTAPEEPENGAYWLDTSSASGDVLRVYSADSDAWSAVTTTFLKIAATGIGAQFAQYDSACLSGVLEDIVGSCASTLNATLVLWDVDDDYIVVTGLLEKSAIQSIEDGAISLVREIPDLDYITQSDNRVWGCSSSEHAIYASKLGDATNWYNYMDTAADSYAVTVGSDGDFTGATVSLGYLLFFKESLIHKVYGTKPANYQVTTVSCRGVADGCAKSLATVNETLYYKSNDDVMQYDGGLPSAVGDNLGKRDFSNAVAGATNGCYYISMQEGDAHHLFCYDDTRGAWHREDDAAVVDFATAGTCLYFLKTDGTLWAVGTPSDEVSTGVATQESEGDTQSDAEDTATDDSAEDSTDEGSDSGVQAISTAEDEANTAEDEADTDDTEADTTASPTSETQVCWYGETGDIGLYTPDNKTVSKIEVRIEASEGAQIKIEAQYDSSGVWEELASFEAARKRMVLLPIVPRRFDHMKLRYSGVGDATLYTVTKSLEGGSELAWQT